MQSYGLTNKSPGKISKAERKNNKRKFDAFSNQLPLDQQSQQPKFPGAAKIMRLRDEFQQQRKSTSSKQQEQIKPKKHGKSSASPKKQ